MLYVIYACEAIPQPQPDGPEYLEIIVVACFAIAGLALIIILVIWLKRRSYGEWKSMDIPSYGT
jgi:hypothetical protein